MSEVRKDPISGRSVIIAAERAKRPRALNAGDISSAKRTLSILRRQRNSDTAGSFRLSPQPGFTRLARLERARGAEQVSRAGKEPGPAAPMTAAFTNR
jgi:hypothetical protein